MLAYSKMLVCSSEAYLFYFYIFTKLSFIFPFIPVSTLGKDSDPSRRAEPATIYGRLSMRARLQQYVNCELPDVQAGFRKDRRTRDQIANIRRIIEKAREFQKKTSALLTTPKPLTVWITTNCEKFFKRWEY